MEQKEEYGRTDPEELPRGVVPAPKRRHPVRTVLLGVLGLFVLIQLVPYGHDHSNPPTSKEPAWDSLQTRSLAVQSCFDCHSNQTTWYWYTNIAPFSWLVQRDVVAGRATLNFSEWNRPQDGAGDVFDAISGGSMPLWYYTLIHPGTTLSPAEKQQLIAGLRKTYQSSPPIGGG